MRRVLIFIVAITMLLTLIGCDGEKTLTVLFVPSRSHDASKILELFSFQNHLPLAKEVLQEVIPSSENNIILNPIAFGINADISDQIATDEASVWILNNTILNAANSSRPPIYVNNSAVTKTLKQRVIKDNVYDY